MNDMSCKIMTVTVPKEIINFIDTHRGLIKRSTFVTEMLQRSMLAVESQNKKVEEI